MDWLSATDAEGTGVTVGADATVSFYIVLPSTLSNNFTDPTIVRLRGHLMISMAAGEAQGAVGIIPWTDANDTPPAATEGPLPWSAGSMEWMWIRYFGSLSGTGLARDDRLNSSGPIEIDSRAMRRMGNDKGLLMVVQNVGTAAMLVRFGVRILVKE